MTLLPTRLLLDTQIFILGYARPAHVAAQVLNLIRNNRERFVVLLSDEVIDQVRRVGKRVGDKDWAGWVLSRIWQEFEVELVGLPQDATAVLDEMGFSLPTEDMTIFLTAWLGKADVMVSENREFVRDAATAQNLFACLSAAEFLSRYGSRVSPVSLLFG